MDCSTPGFPVHHQLLDLAQTHIHWVGDAIQPSHLLLSPSPSTFNLSQHQGLYQWVSSLHQVAKVLGLQLQHQPSNEYSGLISFRIDWFDLLAVQGAEDIVGCLSQTHFLLVKESHVYSGLPVLEGESRREPITSISWLIYQVWLTSHTRMSVEDLRLSPWY